LATKARALPATPGVYLMKDAAGTVIYIGKAARLRDRVGSYFVPSADLGFKKQPLLDRVTDFDTIDCDGEWEALLTENRLIKDTKPRFNVRLTDGKTYPYLVVTQREDYPRVFVTRNPTGAGDEALTALLRGAKVFGPFTNAGALREAVQHLQGVFKFRTCTLDIVAGDPKNRHFRPCLLAAINRCTAPCAERVPLTVYGDDVARFVRFLGTKRADMLREMRSQMEEAAAKLDFERAAALRDQIKALEKLDQRARASDGFQPEAEVAYLDPMRGGRALQRALGLDAPVRCVEGFDIAHLMGTETVASKVSFVDGRPFKEEYRRFKIKVAGNDDYAAMREVVSRRYRDAGIGQELFPDVVLIDGGPGQLAAAMEAFAQLPVRPPMVIALAKKEEIIHVAGRDEPLRLPRTNAGLRLCQAVRDEAHRFSRAYHHALRKKKVLGDAAPKPKARRPAPKAQPEPPAPPSGPPEEPPFTP
jgi:excinuclease ABC subunit C